MTTKTTTPAGHRPGLATRLSFEAFLAKLSPKDKLNVERHITACEADAVGAHAELWKRLATTMMTLSGFAAKTNGQHSMQFFIQDGKYRMQVFALEDLRDGKIVLYAANVLDAALKSKELHAPERGGEPNAYRIGTSRQTLKLEELDGKTPNPAPFYKDMLGWNRRALRIVLPLTATPEQVDAAEALLVLAAQKQTS